LSKPVLVSGRVVKRIYLAGKVTRTTWRDEIFLPGRELKPGRPNESAWSGENHCAIEAESLDGKWVDSPDCLPLPDGRLLTLTGPYWKKIDEDVAGGHATIRFNTDGGPDDDDWSESEQAHSYVLLEDNHGTPCDKPEELTALREMIVRTIRRSDLVFAWVDSLDCFGTLYELGIAHGMNIPCIVAFHTDLDVRELWLARHGATIALRAESPGQAWRRAWEWLIFSPMK
jgi:hypothetical protein